MSLDVQTRCFLFALAHCQDLPLSLSLPRLLPSTRRRISGRSRSRGNAVVQIHNTNAAHTIGGSIAGDTCAHRCWLDSSWSIQLRDLSSSLDTLQLSRMADAGGAASVPLAYPSTPRDGKTGKRPASQMLHLAFHLRPSSVPLVPLAAALAFRVEVFRRCSLVSDRVCPSMLLDVPS